MDDAEYLANFVSTITKITNITHSAFEAYEKSLRTNNRIRVLPADITREEEGFLRNCIKSLQEKGEHFFKATRMSVDNFNLLLSLLDKRLQRFSNRKPIDPETRLSVTLMYLAQGCSIQTLAWAFNLGFSTVRKIIFETCDAIWGELHAMYVAPPNSHELKTISDKYYYETGIPNCLGAIDGKHVRISRPYNSGYSLKNFKSFGLVLLASCNANYVFTYVDVAAPSNPGDGGVFARSGFGSKLLNGTLELPCDANLPGTSTSFPYYFVGDSTYPLKTNLLRPYPGQNLPEAKTKLNTMLSKARGYIENCFGILANRWRVVHSKINACPENADKVILATIALHNFLMLQDDKNYFSSDLVDHTENNQDILGQWRNEIRPLQSYQPKAANRASTNSLELRDKLKEFFLSNIV